ncbi:hypothetical protein ACFQ60_11025 [Streptomyces zhihengii]
MLRRHLARGAMQFGFELGTGVRTYVSASAPYAIAVAVLLSGVPAGPPWPPGSASGPAGRSPRPCAGSPGTGSAGTTGSRCG